MAQLHLCQPDPHLSVHADLDEMGTWLRVPRFSLPLYGAGLLGVEVRGNGVLGEGWLRVGLGDRVLFEGRVRDSSCQRNFKMLVKNRLMEVLGVKDGEKSHVFDETDLKCLDPGCG